MSVNNTKRLLAYHISRLQDKDPQVRLRSIHELALLGDNEALTALQDVYKQDASVEVRKAAQDAGRQIFLKNQAESATNSPQPQE